MKQTVKKLALVESIADIRGGGVSCLCSRSKYQEGCLDLYFR